MMRPFNHDSNMGRGGGNGPLLTEHLRDLDLELELLKRKREMIEKQQSLLNQQQAFNLQSYNYDQPQYRDTYDDGPQFSGSNRDYSSGGRDFTQLYNEPQQSRERFPRQSAKKRLGDYVWSDPPFKKSYGGPPNKFGSGPPQKFSSGSSNKFLPGPSNKFGGKAPNKFGGGQGKAFNTGPGPKQSKYVPPAERFNTPKNQGKPKPSQRFKEQEKPARPKPNDFKPNKVNKPKANVANKVSTNIPKHLLAETVGASNTFSPILKPDEVPSQQVAGRLELALGNILKVIKDRFGKQAAYSQFFIDVGPSKQMKQTIRERIRSVMLNKPVGHIGQIMQMYRNEYPEHTDKEILEIGMRAKGHGKSTTFKFIAEDVVNPYLFFKKNFVRLMSVSLNKMFEKLQTVYKEEAVALKEQSEVKDKTATSEEATTEADKTGNSDTCVPAESVVDLTDSEKAEGDADMTEKPEETEEVTENPEANGESSKKPEQNDAVSKKSEENKAVSEKTGGTVSEKPKEEENASDEPSEAEMVRRRYEITAVRKKYEDMMDEMIPPKLVYWMPKLKTLIMKALSADVSFESVQKELIEKTEAMINKRQAEEEKAALVDGKQQRLKYYVKIQGRPTLPNKFLMKQFLEQFNPKIVKKIKNLRNLLFVGFENKSDFDRMVAANGAYVGTDKIIVKISQWVTNEALNEPSNATSTPNTSAVSEGDVTMKDVTEETAELNETLDNQIDELLTSIRNEEEEENAEAATEDNNDNENQDGGDNGAEQEDNENEEALLEENNDNGIEEAGNDQENKEESNENVEAAEAKDNVEEAEAKDKVEEAEAKDKVEELKSEAKETGRATPTRASNRLASAPSTPSSVRTRRSSKLAQN